MNNLPILALAALFTGVFSSDADAAKIKTKAVTKNVSFSLSGKKIVHKKKIVKVKRPGLPTLKKVVHRDKVVKLRANGTKKKVIHKDIKLKTGKTYYGPAPVAYAPVIAVPAYQVIYQQIWVSEQFEDVLVGYDVCGNPIYQQVLIAPGGYRTAAYKVYAGGSQEFIGFTD